MLFRASDDMKLHDLSILITTMLSPILQILFLLNFEVITVMASNVCETGNSMKTGNLTIHLRLDVKFEVPLCVALPAGPFQK